MGTKQTVAIGEKTQAVTLTSSMDFHGWSNGYAVNPLPAMRVVKDTQIEAIVTDPSVRTLHLVAHRKGYGKILVDNQEESEITVKLNTTTDKPIVAQAEANYSFAYWQEDGIQDPTHPPVLMDRDKTLTAIFRKKLTALTIHVTDGHRDLEGIAISVGSHTGTTDAKGLLLLNVAPGDALLSIAPTNNYVGLTEQLSIAGDKLTKEYKLKLQTKQEGVFSVTIGGQKKAGVKILINGREYTTDNEGAARAELPVGNLPYTLQLDGEEIYAGEISIMSQSTTREDIVLVPITVKSIANGTLSVQLNGEPLGATKFVKHKDVLTIKATATSGYRVKSVTVNGTSITNGTTYTVKADDMKVEVFAEMEALATPILLSFEQPANGTLTVSRGGSNLNSGAELKSGDVLTITATAASGYRVKSVTVNGKDFTNGTTYNVKPDDTKVEVVAEMEKVETNSTPVEIAVSEDYSVMPNPATSTIRIAGLKEVATLQLYTLNGGLVLSTQVVPNGTVDVSTLRPGVYTLRVGSKTLRFVKL